MPKKRIVTPRIRKDGSIDKRYLLRGALRPQFNMLLRPEAAQFIRDTATAQHASHGEIVELLIEEHRRFGTSLGFGQALREICDRCDLEPAVVLREMIELYAQKRGVEVAHHLSHEGPI